MEKDELYNQYDKIIADSLSKILDLHSKDKYIGIDNIDEMQPVFWQILSMADMYFRVEIYARANCFKRWKIRHQYKNLRVKKLSKNSVANFNPTTFFNEIANNFNVDFSIYEKIYDEYYRKEK